MVCVWEVPGFCMAFSHEERGEGNCWEFYGFGAIPWRGCINSQDESAPFGGILALLRHFWHVSDILVG